VAIIEEESSKADNQQSPKFEQQFHHHRRFLALMRDNLYNCELCGVGIAVLQIVTTDTHNGEQQFRVCSTCLEHVLHPWLVLSYVCDQFHFYILLDF
jgi:hypothetical protein